jgi:hypothetical protein
MKDRLGKRHGAFGKGPLLRMSLIIKLLFVLNKKKTVKHLCTMLKNIFLEFLFLSSNKLERFSTNAQV